MNICVLSLLVFSYTQNLRFINLPFKTPTELLHTSYVTGQQHATQGGKRLIKMNQALWENNLNFLNYVAISLYYMLVISIRQIEMSHSHFRVTRAATRCQETPIHTIQSYGCADDINVTINPLNDELNPICHLLALLGAHNIFHVSGLRIN